MTHIIYALLEGEDDERFLNKVIKARLEKKYSKVKVYKYAQVTRNEREKFINWLKKSSTAYIFFSDMDKMACYTKKKERITLKTAKNVDVAKIAIVKTEIESWYLAGLNYHDALSLNIWYSRNTENITKEDFTAIHKKYASRIDFMMVILEKFSLDIAKIQNKSFRYFCDKFL